MIPVLWRVEYFKVYSVSAGTANNHSVGRRDSRSSSSEEENLRGSGSTWAIDWDDDPFPIGHSRSSPDNLDPPGPCEGPHGRD
jgi:hypothetical protein